MSLSRVSGQTVIIIERKRHKIHSGRTTQGVKDEGNATLLD